MTTTDTYSPSGHAWRMVHPNGHYFIRVSTNHYRRVWRDGTVAGVESIRTFDELHDDGYALVRPTTDETADSLAAVVFATAVDHPGSAA